MPTPSATPTRSFLFDFREISFPKYKSSNFGSFKIVVNSLLNKFIDSYFNPSPHREIMAPDTPLHPAEATSIDVLKGKIDGERRYGYDINGKQKRILLNAFDMNGVGHIRYADG